MHKAIIAGIVSLGLAGCGVVSSFVDGIKYAKAVEEDLEQITGLKPGVGFNFSNARLQSVTVTFPRLYDAKPVRELAGITRTVVTKEFKQSTKKILLAFTLDRADADGPQTAPGAARTRASAALTATRSP